MKNDSRAVGKDTGRGLLSIVVGDVTADLGSGRGGCCGSGPSEDGDGRVGRPVTSVQPSRRKTIWTRTQAA